MTAPPLAHLRVVDLTDLRGALAGRLLADLGADVIKVEPPAGDPSRWRPPFAGDVVAADRSLPFLYRNANKRGIIIDLAEPHGRQRFIDLCGGADILIDNLALDERRQWGLTPDDVRARHPHLIHLAIADFGLSGPRAHWRAEPLPAFAASGALHSSGFLDRPPCWMPGFLAHDCASVFAVAGALTAVLDRAQHGHGQSVEVSVQEAALHGLTPWSIPLADYNRVYPMLPAAPPRNADGTYLVLPTADGYVRLLPGTVRHWKGFVALLGDPETLAGPEWENAIYRLLNGDVIRMLAADSLRERRRDEVFAAARQLGVTTAPVQTPDEFVAADQTRARGYFRRTDFPYIADAPFAPLPFNFSRTPAVLRRPAPAPGEDEAASFAPHAADHGSASPSSSPPLAGMRVIDLGVGAVGPEVCWLLDR